MTTATVALYRIVNIKRSTEFRGTLAEAIAEAALINDVMEPSFGTQVELDGEVLHNTDWNEFDYRTDGESGTIAAPDFEHACQKLEEMFSDETIADGAWGWVENALATERYYVARENMP